MDYLQSKSQYQPIESDNHIANLTKQLKVNEQATNVLCICGSFSQCSILHIYNLVSNFGNIKKIYLLRNINYCIIEFENLEYSKYAKEYLNGLFFFGASIQTFFSNNQTLTYIESIKSLISDNDVFFGTLSSYSLAIFRFRPHRNLTVKEPTRTIHVSNLSSHTSNPDSMWDIFSTFGIVECVKVLNTQQKYMCVVKMENVAQAVMAIACMHNSNVDNHSIQISFTHQKI